MERIDWDETKSELNERQARDADGYFVGESLFRSTQRDLADHWRSLAMQEREKVQRLEAQLHLCEIHLRNMLAVRREP